MRVSYYVEMLIAIRGDYVGRPQGLAFPPPSFAIKGLEQTTGQSFGYDWKKWEAYLIEQGLLTKEWETNNK
ncbi:hypothetical protein LBMAG53_38300 [Planctomycetota bacterium]|nr:hypothetical protein LBMAG53_38300 [Planctomycetota bacterium]